MELSPLTTLGLCFCGPRVLQATLNRENNPTTTTLGLIAKVISAGLNSFLEYFPRHEVLQVLLLFPLARALVINRSCFLVVGGGQGCGALHSTLSVAEVGSSSAAKPPATLPGE